MGTVTDTSRTALARELRRKLADDSVGLVLTPEDYDVIASVVAGSEWVQGLRAGTVRLAAEPTHSNLWQMVEAAGQVFLNRNFDGRPWQEFVGRRERGMVDVPHLTTTDMVNLAWQAKAAGYTVVGDDYAGRLLNFHQGAQTPAGVRDFLSDHGLIVRELAIGGPRGTAVFGEHGSYLSENNAAFDEVFAPFWAKTMTGGVSA